MPAAISPQVRKPALSLPVALGLVLLIWLVLVTVYTWRPGDPLAALLQSIPGILAVGVLLTSGFSFSDCFPKFAPLIKKGILYLGMAFLLVLYHSIFPIIHGFFTWG